MEKRLILKSQANTVFKLINNHNLDAGSFEWKEVEADYFYISKLFYKPSEYYFIFGIEPRYDEHFAIFSPGKESPVQRVKTKTWENQIQFIDLWLSFLKREIDEPSLWEKLFQEKVFADKVYLVNSTNEPFKQEELIRIATDLSEINEYIKTSINLSQEHAGFVEQNLNYLKEASERQGRYDWFHTLIGVLFTMVLSIGLSPNEARDLFRFVADALRWVTNTLHLLQ